MRQIPVKYNISCRNSKKKYCDNDEQWQYFFYRLVIYLSLYSFSTIIGLWRLGLKYVYIWIVSGSSYSQRNRFVSSRNVWVETFQNKSRISRNILKGYIGCYLSSNVHLYGIDLHSFSTSLTNVDILKMFALFLLNMLGYTRFLESTNACSSPFQKSSLCKHSMYYSHIFCDYSTKMWCVWLSSVTGFCGAKWKVKTVNPSNSSKWSSAGCS
jgi:hypothetical protein